MPIVIINYVQHTHDVHVHLHACSHPACNSCGCCATDMKVYCVCGAQSCDTCIESNGTMFKRTSGWKCAGCVGTPSSR